MNCTFMKLKWSNVYNLVNILHSLEDLGHRPRSYKYLIRVSVELCINTNLQGDSKSMSKNSNGDRGHIVKQLLPQTFFLFRPYNGDRGQTPTKN